MPARVLQRQAAADMAGFLQARGWRPIGRPETWVDEAGPRLLATVVARQHTDQGKGNR